MDNLYLQETKSSPAIAFNGESGVLEISGESFPENAYEFYKPVLNWITRFCAHFTESIVFNCRISYLNTGSIRTMLDVFDLFEDRFRQGREVRVTWFCDSENDRAVEIAEEFMEDVTFPFDIKPLDKSR
jgi:hypothetical protein